MNFTISIYNNTQVLLMVGNNETVGWLVVL